MASFQQGEAEDVACPHSRSASRARSWLEEVGNDKDDVEEGRRRSSPTPSQTRRGEGRQRHRPDRRSPRIDLDIVVVEGTDTTSLQKGPGHYSPADNKRQRKLGDGSAFPGQGETIGVAGHRTTYLAPFRRIEDFEGGDEITLQMPYATFTYEVEKSEIVAPSEVEVVANCPEGEYCEGDEPYERLVLTACHPLYSAAQRYVELREAHRRQPVRLR